MPTILRSSNHSQNGQDNNTYSDKKPTLNGGKETKRNKIMP